MLLGGTLAFIFGLKISFMEVGFKLLAVLKIDKILSRFISIEHLSLFPNNIL